MKEDRMGNRRRSKTRSTPVAYFVRLLVLNSQICSGNQSACFHVRPGPIVFALTIKWIGYKSLAVDELCEKTLELRMVVKCKNGMKY